MAASTDSNSVASGKGLLGSKYARNKQLLMATIDEIRATGAALEVDLPTIVVAGNQSSGKSSLIEAISSINLPRAAGTCTRVPIEVRLKHEEESEWTCIVKIRRETVDQNKTDERRPEVTFGDPITDRSLVETTIRRAQLAILNPSVNMDRFVTCRIPREDDPRPLGSTKQYQFSKDVVVLEISGSDVADLTLVDLPGLIQNVSQKDDKNNIGLIEDMVNSYIRKDCLILLVLTMKDDLQNQKAALLAREADPDGKRTIGVLTKVDTVQNRAEIDLWLKVVQGEREPLAHGYYVTRQPDADELAEGITFANAREKEDNFFRTNKYWKKLDRHLKKRLGTKNLSEYLSDQLCKFIKNKLPELEKQIGARYKEIVAELEKLGSEPPDDPTGTMLGLLSGFERNITGLVEGAAEQECFMQEVNDMSATFEQGVSATRPDFLSRKRPINDSEAEDGGRQALDSAMENPAAQMYLDDLRCHITVCRTRELPNQLPPTAFQKLIKRSTSTWEELAVEMLGELRPAVQGIMDDAVEEVFGRYSYGELPKLVNAIVREQLSVLYQNTSENIKKLVALELRPYTRNTQYLEKTQARVLAQLRAPRIAAMQQDDDDARPGGVKQSPMQAAQPVAASLLPSPMSTSTREEHINHIMASLAAVGQSGIKEEDLAKLRPVDEFETELNLMAQTIAYWEVAYKRIIDNVPRFIDAELLQQLSGKIRAALLRELKMSGEDGHNRCKEFLEEAPEVVERRRDLRVRRDRLGDAKSAIKRFKTK